MKIVKYDNQKDFQAELTKILYDASVAYYNGKTPTMSDREFDIRMEDLMMLEREWGYAYDISPTIRVGASSVTSLTKSGHEQPALSLDKVKYKERKSLEGWLGDKTGVLSWKMDGLTVVATYDNGRLTSAVTRGDGYVGSVITHNAIYFVGLPTVIPFKDHLVVRGECVMRYSEFERVNAEAGGEYENPRNLASATIQLLDSNESRKREIEFYAFELVTPEMDKQTDSLDFIRNLGFGVVEHCTVCADDLAKTIDMWQKQLGSIPYPTDGLVLTYDDQKYARSLGTTGHHPRGSIAMKWTDETQRSVVREIDWSVGKTGVITPVAVFDGVRLGVGSTVTRASLHNVSIMRALECGVGSEVEVYLANMVIPQVAEATPGKITIPDKCPVCNGHTEIVNHNGIETLICTNPSCSAKLIKQLATFASKGGVNIDGLSEAKIEDLISLGYVNRPSDFYKLKDAGLGLLKTADGWGSKSVRNLLSAVEISRHTDLEHFIYALSIPLCGHDLSKKLAKAFDNDAEKFAAFVRNPDHSLEQIDGIGEVKASNIYNWCEQVDIDDFIWLLGEMVFKKHESISDTNITDMVFVITGSVHTFENRDAFKKFVEDRGGKVASSVTSKTNYLVNNDTESMSIKNRKAKELGVEIISEDEFLRRFG